MSEKIEHTPTPWEKTDCCIHEGDNVIGETDRYQDAAFIVKACNNHAALVEALSSISGYLEAVNIRSFNEQDLQTLKNMADAALKGLEA